MAEQIEIVIKDESPKLPPQKQVPQTPAPTDSAEGSGPSKKPSLPWESAASIREGIERRAKEREAARESDSNGSTKVPRAETPKERSLPWESAADIRRGIAERAEKRRQRREEEESAEQGKSAVEIFTDAVKKSTVAIKDAFGGRKKRDPDDSRSDPQQPTARARSRTYRRARVAAKRSLKRAREIASSALSNAGKTRAGRAAASVGRGAYSAAGKVGGMLAGRAAAAAGAAGGSAVAAGGVAAGITALVLPLAALAIAVVGAVVAFRSFVEFFKSQADQLEEFSGAVAGVRAEIEANQMQSKIERAQRIGPQVANVEASRGRLEEAQYELLTSIYEILAKLAPLAELGNDSLTVIVSLINSQIQQAESTLANVNPFATQQERDKEAAEAAAANKALAEAFGELFTFNGNDAEKRFVLDHNPFAPMKAKNANPNVPNGGRVL